MKRLRVGASQRFLASRSCLVCLLVMTVALGGLPSCSPGDDVEPEVAAEFTPEVGSGLTGYENEIAVWRVERIGRLIAEDGWVTLVGLFWLADGTHRVGTVEGSDILLPAGKAPAELGVLTVDGDGVRLDVAPGAEVLHDGVPVDSLVLTDDSEGSPTSFDAGDLTAFVIRRGDQRALRVRDRQHPARTAFVGIEHFAVDAKWRLEARFEPYDPPQSIPVPNILGSVNDTTSSGSLVFEVDGGTHRLDVLAEPGDPELFIIFGDQTSGKETYGGGRYLYAKAPDEDGKVIVDFNKAYNPPCVYTEFATCPLPPPQNRLPIAVTAGDRVDKKG